MKRSRLKVADLSGLQGFIQGFIRTTVHGNILSVRFQVCLEIEFSGRREEASRLRKHLTSRVKGV